MNNIKVAINKESDIVIARRQGRSMARELGFGSADQTRLATAVSELVRNVIQHAGKGTCIISDKSTEDRIIVQIIVQDNGPGISDINRAMEQDYSTGSGLGAGLPGTERLVTGFHIESRPGHTEVRIEMVKWRR